jgi:hypothetical protein
VASFLSTETDQYNPNRFPIGDGFGLFFLRDKFEEMHFWNRGQETASLKTKRPEKIKSQEFRGICPMNKLLSCEFNMDTACVELRFADGRMVSIDCTAVENAIADNRFEQSELDYLIYNAPAYFAQRAISVTLPHIRQSCNRF